LRAEVNDKSLQADILEVLKSKADGIYIYTVTGGAAATPAVSVVSAAPSVVTSLPATPKKNTPVPQTKPDVKAKPAVKAAAKAEIKPVAQADQKPVIKAEVKRSLPVNLFYRGDLDQKETDNDKALIAKIWSRSNIMKAQRAVNVSNEAYGVRLISTDTNPYISNDLYLSLVSTAACDLNLVGACVVFEKDSTSGKSVTNSYYVGSAPMNNFSSEVRVARSDVKDKTLQADVSEVLKSKADGIYVYSVAESAYQVKEAAKNSISAEEAAKIAGETVALTAASAAAAVQIITDETEAAKARREIQEYVAKYTSSEDTKKRMSSAKGGKWVHNDCIIKSVQNDEDPKHGLRTVRRIFILDFVNVARMFQGKAEMPLKIGKGRILCNMWDGKVQRVPVEIKEYVSPFTVGLVLSKSNQNLVAAGVGFANGAVDILMEKDFAGLVEVDAMALIGGLSFAPVILNGTGKGTPFILATQISVNPKWLLINTRASLGVRYEIGVDPDET
jgi:hypothetical protein